MYATDFLFDGQRASDFGLMVCSFNGGFETAAGGEIEHNVVKTPARDNFTFYGSQFNSVITWNFSICKNPCRNDNMYFNQYEESMIAKWLVKTDGYRWIQFDQEGYEDIFYNVCISMMPHQVAGRTVGFDLVATSDCAYGFTDIIKRNATIHRWQSLELNVHSDINTYILPIVKIQINTDNEKKVWVCNSDPLTRTIIGKELTFENIYQDIIMDSNTEIITGLSKPDDFNWNFLKLINGINVISGNSSSETGIEVEIQYREPRYVRV